MRYPVYVVPCIWVCLRRVQTGRPALSPCQDSAPPRERCSTPDGDKPRPKVSDGPSGGTEDLSVWGQPEPPIGLSSIKVHQSHTVHSTARLLSGPGSVSLSLQDCQGGLRTHLGLKAEPRGMGGSQPEGKTKTKV